MCMHNKIFIDTFIVIMMNKRITYTLIAFIVLLVLNLLLLKYSLIVNIVLPIYILIDFILAVLLINYDVILKHMDFILTVIVFSLFYIMVFTITGLILSTKYTYLQSIKFPPDDVMISGFFILGLITSIIIKIRHSHRTVRPL